MNGDHSNPERSDSLRIVIFAKAPVPGSVKTRLIPALGADGAAALARRMLGHAQAQACAAALGPVEVCLSPDDAILPAAVRPSGDVVISAQGAGGLGCRLARNARRSIAAGARWLVMGTDCPALDAAHLRQAAATLAEADACMIPAHDGGYVLLGLRRYHDDLFTDMPWGGAEVAQRTAKRIAALGWRLHVLAPLPDIDRPEDLMYLPGSWTEQSGLSNQSHVHCDGSTGNLA